MRQMIALELAFSWRCPLCGKANFARGYAPEFAPDVEERIRRRAGDAIDRLRNYPANVKCSGCGERFKTEM